MSLSCESFTMSPRRVVPSLLIPSYTGADTFILSASWLVHVSCNLYIVPIFLFFVIFFFTFFRSPSFLFLFFLVYFSFRFSVFVFLFFLVLFPPLFILVSLLHVFPLCYIILE